MKIRNVGIRTVRVGDLVDAEFNYRTHGDDQKAVLNEAVNEIGWVGYPDVYELPDGRLKLCDGHLRKIHLIEKYGPDQEIEVNVTDLTEEEARKALLTKDFIASMAGTDNAALRQLKEQVAQNTKNLQRTFEALTDRNREAFLDSEMEQVAVTKIDIEKPPETTWALVGIPTVRYVEIASLIESIASVKGVFCEVTANSRAVDGQGANGEVAK